MTGKNVKCVFFYTYIHIFYILFIYYNEVKQMLIQVKICFYIYFVINNYIIYVYVHIYKTIVF